MAEPARAYWGGKRIVGFEGGRDGQDRCIIYRHLLTGRISLPRIRLTWGPAGYEVDRLCARTSSIWTDKERLSFASVKFIGDVENSHVHDSPVLGDSGSCRGDQRATKKMGKTAHSQAFSRGVFAPSSSRRPLQAVGRFGEWFPDDLMMAGRLHSPVGLDRRRGGGAAPCLHVAAAAAVMPWLCFDRHKTPLVPGLQRDSIAVPLGSRLQY